VAWHLGQSFQRLDPELGLTTASVAYDGCSLERGATAARYFGGGGDVPLGDNDCTSGWSEAVARFQPEVAVVVLAGQILGEWQIDGGWTHLCDPRYDEWYGKQVLDGVTTLASSGARVVLVAPPPGNLSWLPPELNEAVKCLGRIERAVVQQHPMVSVVDLGTLVCPQGRCRDEIDGATLRPDGLHFEGPGADVVVRWVAPQLWRLARSSPPAASPPSSFDVAVMVAGAVGVT
jgi:hypothetical protein